MLELVHAGYSLRGITDHSPLLAEGRPRLSQPAVTAAINLYLAGEQTMGEIAASVGRSNAWASRVVDELIDAGLVERLADSEDRRVIHVRLVPDAVRKVEQAYNIRGEWVARALAGLDPAGRAAVRTFLARAIAELSEP